MKWKMMQDIRVGDYAVINRSPVLFPNNELDLREYVPLTTKRTRRYKLPQKLNPDLAFLIGALVAEGNISKEQIGFCNSDPEFLGEFKTKFKCSFPGCRLHEYVRSPAGYTKKCYSSLEIHSLQLIHFFHNMGLAPVRAGKKDVPEVIRLSTKESMAAFVRGYAEGDGSVYLSGAPEIAFISMSVELLKKLQVLLLRFGIESSYRYQPSKSIYKLLIRGFDNLNRFREQIGFVTQRKRKKLDEVCALNADRRIMSKTDFVPYLADYIRNNGYRGKVKDWLLRHNIDRLPKIKAYRKTMRSMLNEADKSLYENLIVNDYLFDRIVAVEDTGIQNVYSIRVDSNCHSFVSNGFISHNTEVRMAKITAEMLSDIDKETVAFTDNFDGTMKEPVVLPSKIPNLLINGSAGIAVGMATNIPPHNLREIIDGTIAVIDGADDIKLLQIVSGPDFPTGGSIVGRSGILQAYKTGRGIIKVRGKVTKDEKKNTLVITEIPYQLTKTAIIESIVEAAKDKKIEGVSGVHDRSDKDGMEVIIDIKRGYDIDVVLNQLYAHTQLQTSFGIINLALVGKEPKVLGIYDMISEFVEFRKEIVRKRCEFELKEAKARAHILEGLRIALNNIDPIVAFLRKSKDMEAARAGLMTNYSLTEIQANAILDMKLSRLIALEREKIENEYAELVKKIAWLNEVLADVAKMLAIIKEELAEIREKYGDDRRTEIVADEEEQDIEALIPNDEVVVVISSRGYVKRVGLDEYRAQRRGGKA